MKKLSDIFFAVLSSLATIAVALLFFIVCNIVGYTISLIVCGAAYQGALLSWATDTPYPLTISILFSCILFSCILFSKSVRVKGARFWVKLFDKSVKSF
jgi:hypothetical protein